MEFRVSVIIPVFNCEKFVFEAIESAISCPEVGEVIVIDDGSTDSSFQICKNLARSNLKIKIFTHPGQKNLGPSASRNLGIRKANFPFISFLDSDDWYLDNRFKKDKLTFENHPEIDAVYSCSIHEYNLGKNDLRYGVRFDPLVNCAKDLEPVAFYKKILTSNITLFDTNSITLRRSFLLNHKLFDERLNLHQDTELWFRLLRSGKFMVGEFLRPVSVVRAHPDHRISSRSPKSSQRMWCVLIDNLGIDNLYKFEIDFIYRRLLRVKSRFYSNSFYRRLYFYGLYFIYFFHKEKFIIKLINNCA